MLNRSVNVSDCFLLSLLDALTFGGYQCTTTNTR